MPRTSLAPLGTIEAQNLGRIRRSHASTCSICDKWRLARRSLQINWVAQETLWNISAKRILGLNVDLDFCSAKSGISLISGPLPNSDAKGWGPPIGRALELKRGPWGVEVRSAKLPRYPARTCSRWRPFDIKDLTIQPRYHDRREFLSTTMRKGTSLVKCIRLLIIRDQHREFRPVRRKLAVRSRSDRQDRSLATTTHGEVLASPLY